MPADRLLHPRAGHSEKVTGLTDMEYRVWTQYLLSADDFGVMRCSAITLQADNDALATRKPLAVQRALERLVAVALICDFEHQGRRYVYQRDWQTWQKVEYPRATLHPMPPPESIASCDEPTRRLFELHPGGTGKKFRKRSENIPETPPENSEGSAEISAATREAANANGYRLTAIGLEGGLGETTGPRNGGGASRQAPIHDNSHRKHAHCGRVCLPASLFGEFVRRRNHADADREIRDWALVVEGEWGPDGPRASEEPGDSFEFWKARYTEKWPAAVTLVDKRTPAWLR